MVGQTAAARELDGREDFDFLIGAWDSRQRKLRKRLAGCTDWDEFSATLEVRKILGGLGNVDELVMQTAAGEARGLTVRLFDPAAHVWRIYWAATGPNAQTLDTPMVGRFTNGVGVFYCHEVFDGEPVFTRFLWIRSGPEACRWEQAFSVDGGQTWETNWTAEFTRRSATA